MIKLFNISICVYFVALVLGVIGLFSKRKWFEMFSVFCLVIGDLAQAAYIIMRWRMAGHAPFSNMFESLVLFAWALVFVYLILRLKLRIAVLTAAVSLFAMLTLAYASTFGFEIRPLIPALQSNWLTAHVLSCFLGYSAFAISALASIVYLVGSRSKRKLGDGVDLMLETTIGKTIAFGFLFLSVGIITGSVWANSAWGTYWSWDPKETWSLITWFIYAVFLHCRFMKGWRGRKAAWISLLGFASVIFTYFGVNFILSGLHSYA